MYSPAEETLRKWVNDKSSQKPELFAMISNEQLKVEDFTLRRRVELTGNGPFEAIKISTAELRGEINIDKGKFPALELFSFDYVIVKFVDSAAATPRAAKGYSSDRQAMPAALGNGSMVMSQNNGEIFKTDIADCTSDADGEFVDKAKGKKLSNPIVVEDDKVITLTVNPADGESFTTGVSNGHGYAEFSFVGVKVKQKPRG